MRLSKYLSTIPHLLITVLALSGAHYFARNNERPTIFITNQQSSINVTDKFWQYFHLGQKRLASSVIWIATILESDHDHYKSHDLNSWMFLRFNTISFLEPKFYENYAFGGVYLSIIKDDLVGASVIFDKGLTQYPNDFFLLKDAGFHYYFEVGDFQKAMPIYQKLKTFPMSSPVIISTLARLESQEGRLDDAFNLVSDQYARIKDKDSFIGKKIFKNLYAIKAEIDLNCLNKKEVNCSPKDYEGNPYVKTPEGFMAQKSWEPFKIKRPTKK